jgi:hypothetical protein
MDEPPKPPVYVVDGLAEVGTVLGIAGDSGTAKTTIARALAIAHVQGGTFLGRQVTQGRCVYLHGEDHWRNSVRNLRAMGLCSADDGLRYWCRPPLVLTEESHRRAVERELETHRATMVVFDSATVLSGVEVNDNTAAAEFMSWVGGVANTYGLVAAVLLHERKMIGTGRSAATARNAVLGAMSWRAQCDTLLSLELPANPRGIEQTPEGPVETWTVRVQLPKEREFGDGPEIQGLVKKSLKVDRVLQRLWVELTDAPPSALDDRIVAALSGGPLGRAALLAMLGVKDGGHFRRAIGRLRKAEKITGGGRDGAPFRLANSPPP